MTVQGLTDDGALHDLCKGVAYTYMSEVQGDIAEFGCFWGKSSRTIASQIQNCENSYKGVDNPIERKLWLLDSFQGLPEATLPPDTESPHIKSKAWCWKVKDGHAPTPESVAQQCSAYLPPDQIRIIAGWYKDTLCKLPTDSKFALVHIDCDLYESAYQVLDHLFGNDMLSDGCALFFDDWYCNRGSPAYGEQAAFGDLRVKYLPPFSKYQFTDWGAYGIVGRKFIVHR